MILKEKLAENQPKENDMDKILDGVMKAVEENFKKEGRQVDANTRNMIRESLKAQLLNLPEDKRHEVLGLIASQLKS